MRGSVSKVQVPSSDFLCFCATTTFFGLPGKLHLGIGAVEGLFEIQTLVAGSGIRRRVLTIQTSSLPTSYN